jgi:hypothetical protein
MSSTTDRHGRSDPDAKTDTGPGDGTAVQRGAATGDFDREISVRRILWAGVWLVVITLTSALLVWWFMRGLQVYDEHHEVEVMPMMARNPQQPPPGPRLQPEDPEEDRNKDMVDMRAAEDQSLGRAGWVDQPGGTLQVPIDVAINAIVQRGVAPFPATGAGPAAAAADQTPIEVRTGATMQNTPAAKPPAR